MSEQDNDFAAINADEAPANWKWNEHSVIPVCPDCQHPYEEIAPDITLDGQTGLPILVVYEKEGHSFAAPLGWDGLRELHSKMNRLLMQQHGFGDVGELVSAIKEAIATGSPPKTMRADERDAMADVLEAFEPPEKP